MKVWILTYYQSICGEPDKQEVEKVFYKLDDAKAYIESLYRYERVDEYEDALVYIKKQDRYDSIQIWLDEKEVE